MVVEVIEPARWGSGPRRRRRRRRGARRAEGDAARRLSVRRLECVGAGPAGGRVTAGVRCGAESSCEARHRVGREAAAEVDSDWSRGRGARVGVAGGGGGGMCGARWRCCSGGARGRSGASSSRRSNGSIALALLSSSSSSSSSQSSQHSVPVASPPATQASPLPRLAQAGTPRSLAPRRRRRARLVVPLGPPSPSPLALHPAGPPPRTPKHLPRSP